jgi:hypothetical protein
MIWIYFSNSFLIVPIHEIGLVPPCQPQSINIIRSLSFTGGCIGAIIALITYYFPKDIGGDIKFGILLIFIFFLIFIGGIWYRNKHKKHMEKHMSTENNHNDIELQSPLDTKLHPSSSTSDTESSYIPSSSTSPIYVSQLSSVPSKSTLKLLNGVWTVTQ